MMRALWMLALVAGVAGLAPPAVAEPEELEATPAYGFTKGFDDERGDAEVVDANHDGTSDLGNILDTIDHLMSVGVVFDDTDGQGHIPVRRSDGHYHMACVDLLLVTYRKAGYSFGDRSGHFRSVSTLLQQVQRDRRFHYYPGPAANPRLVDWSPRTPFRVGDMIFVQYDDNNDRHSGIVTGVDPTTGFPSFITQVSIYAENEGIHRSTFNEFFSLRCRQLTGWARPAAWDAAPLPPEERPLTVKPAQPVRRVLPKISSQIHGLSIARDAALRH